MKLRRQRCTECGSVFYTQDPKRTVCGSCQPDTPKPAPAPKPPRRPRKEPEAATAAPDAAE